VIAKPAGLVTHPTASRRAGTLVNRLLGMEIPLSTVGGEERPGIVHRLDAGTSGLMIVAKTDEAHRLLARMLAAREIARTYLALVRGSPAHDVFAVEAPLARRRARVAVEVGTGVEASTDFEVRERLTGCALLVARPRTGRTHQIRVHLSSIGHPIVGDRAYGGSGELARTLDLSRPFLHAWRLAFTHPVTEEPVELEESLPEDLAGALERARTG
jgi:23S rRNA pseudouridine1911/1915/1917 synthase